MARPYYFPPTRHSFPGLTILGVLFVGGVLISSSRPPITLSEQDDGAPAEPLRQQSHAEFLAALRSVRPGMRIEDVQVRMAHYEEKTHERNARQEAGLTGFQRALRRQRTHEGFTGIVSFNHQGPERKEGRYWVACVDDRVVEVVISR